VVNIAVNEKLLISTVTYFWVGEIEKIDDTYIYLTKASWVSHTGRFHAALKAGDLDEVEEIGDVTIAKAAYVDAVAWNHHLPVKTK
jgi:hypothetical protein